MATKDQKPAAAATSGAGDGKTDTTSTETTEAKSTDQSADPAAPPAGAAATDGKPSESPTPSVNAASETASADSQAAAPKAPAPDATASAAAPAVTIEADAVVVNGDLIVQGVVTETVKEKARSMLADLEAQAKAHTEAGEHQAAAAIQGLHAKFVDVLHHVTETLKREEVKLLGEAKEMFEYFRQFI